ncbi:MAG: VOC family protein [Anaerolineae bacterium]|nr:VOC family protein [Anaerolineae bacterium]
MDWKLEVVIVPVEDVDRAKHFYSEQLGFVVDHDTRIDENYRFVQLTPPGSGCSIVVGTDNHNMIAGSIKGLQLVVADIEAARVELLRQGVEVSTIKHYQGKHLVDGRGGNWNSFVFFSDPDGNAWIIQERPAHK